MEITIDQYDNIQRYLNNEMSTLEEKAFEKELETNQDLKSHYLFENDLNNILETQEFKKLYPEVDLNETANKEINHETKNKIALIGEKWKEEKEKKSLKATSQDHIVQINKKPFSLKIWLSIVAAACVIGLIIYSTWPNSQNKETHEIVLNKKDLPFEKKDSLSSIVRGNNIDSINNSNRMAIKPAIDLKNIGDKNYKKDNPPDEAPDKLVASLDDYKNGNYQTIEEQSLQILNERPKINTENSNSRTYDADESRPAIGTNDINSQQNINEVGHYYKGLSFIETRNYYDAKQNLQWVIDSAKQNEDLVIKSKWYKALVFLKEGNKNDAIPLLKNVSSNVQITSYSKKAKAILKELE